MIYQKAGIEIIELGEDEGAVIYDGKTGDTTVLDSVASDIFHCYLTNHSIEETANALSEIYSAEREEIYRDVKEFTDKLVSQGLLVNTGG